jgi:uncharacterized membrane protein
MSLTKHAKKKFLAGLAVMVPLFVTVYVIYFVVSAIEGIVAPVIKDLTLRGVGHSLYIPGAGFILFVVLTYVAGVVATNYMGKKLLSSGEKVLRRIPFVKGIYSSVKDMTDAFSSEKIGSFKEVVLLEFPLKGGYALGFITRRFTFREKALCSVFVPTTPNPTSGYVILVEESELIFLDMAVDDALKYVVSLGTARLDLEWNERKLPT